MLHKESLTILKQTKDYLIIKHQDVGFLEFFISKTASKKFVKCLDLANKIRLLPSDELEELAYTKDLKKDWEYERLFSKDIALCSLIKTFEIDWEVAEEYITDKFILLLVDAIVVRYEALRKLLKTGFRILKKHLPKCPTTPEELLYQIIKEERNLPIETKIIHDFVQYEPSQLAKFHAELAKKDSRNIDGVKLDKLKPIHTRTDKSELLIGRILQCLTNNPAPTHHRLKIKHHFNEYNEAERYINEVLAEMSVGRSNKENLIPTVTWNCGEVCYSDYGRNQRKPPGYN